MFLKRYSEKRAWRILERNRGRIEAACRRAGLPSACLKAVLFRELVLTDWLDIPADAAVGLYWLRRDVRLALVRLGLRRSERPFLRFGPFKKRDSSTGYAQIFAATAIRSARFAAEQGLLSPEELGCSPLPEAEREADLCRFWRRLRRDRDFNFLMAALTLLDAARERVGRLDAESFSPEELMRMFTRYNTAAPGITAYGRAVYRDYLTITDREK